MGPEGGQPDPAVESPPIPAPIAARPWDYSFFQAVRLLQLATGRSDAVGGFHPPDQDAVHFGANVSLAFPAAEIQRIEPREGDPPKMDVNFFGLIGPSGVMPTFYTEFAIERMQARDRTIPAFFDLFHHRLLSLFYRAWEKYHFVIPYERGAGDALTPHLLDLVGLGTPGLQNRQAVHDQALAYYAGLLTQFPRSAAAARQILADYFAVPVEILPFAGAWRRLDASFQTRLNETATSSEQLGIGTVLGDEVWDQQSVVRVRLGPLTLEEYNDFLPGGTALEPLRALLKFYCGEDLDVEVQLVLRREETPRAALGVDDVPAPRLGWVSWVFARPLERDPDETILRLWESDPGNGGRYS